MPAAIGTVVAAALNALGFDAPGDGHLGASARWTPITGGLSHQVVRLDAGGRRFVLRVLDDSVSRAGLGIPLDQEIANTVLAAKTGVGPRVLHVLAEHDALVLEFVDGATLSASEVPAHLAGIAAACRQLHAGEAFGNTFDVFDKLAELIALCREHGLGLPGGYEPRLRQVAGIRAVLAARPLPTVPCHNDLLAENFIADGDRVRIVDYQLSGMNDPAFELGDIAAEAQLPVAAVEELAGAYFGAALTPALVARVRLFQLMSDVTWTLWFRVHHGLLPGKAAAGGNAASFDYAAEAEGKWARALRVLTGSELSGLLAVAGE
ncbi:MAG: phosphotransferase family protein [Kutzneria sp.]|nr:phosphotransferase family protein [Kutzneria sp.]